jgi:hypothetical protein
LIKTIEQLFTQVLNTRDFLYSRELDTAVVDPLIGEDWKGYALAKRDLVFQAMIIGYECFKRAKDPRIQIEEEIRKLKVGAKETVDLGQLYSFLDKERGTIALSLLISIYGALFISDHINEIFPTLRVLAEKGLRIIKSEVIDKKLSIVKIQMETVSELPARIKNSEIQCLN